MNNIIYRRSLATRAFTLGMAVFFLVFCSCPVKKYIRLQLYKHHLTEAPATPSSTQENFGVKDSRDCSIAEKDEQAGVIVFLAFLQHSTDSHDLIPFIFYTAMAFAALYFSRRKQQEPALYRPQRGNLPMVPLYLQIRHFRV
jgi:hypothetical protein